MFTWLPIIGPIIQGIVNIFVQKTNTDLAVKVDQDKTDVAVIQARASVVTAFRYDLGSLLVRDLIMFPVGVHTALVAYVSCFKEVIPQYTWTIDAWPPGMEYIPYAVIAFLFATSWTK